MCRYLLLLQVMGQKKLLRFEEIKQFPNVLIYPENMPGNWKHFFHNPHPIILELACGKGDYTLGLARIFPERNFIGVDLKGNRIWKGARTALEEGLSNVAFLRTQIDKLLHYFSKGEVQEIWITFPDPFLRLSKASKRLTHLKFLQLYHQVLIPGGSIHLKTDSWELYSFTLEVLEQVGAKIIRNIADLHGNREVDPLLNIQTFYEGMHLEAGRMIRYLEFSLPEQLPSWEKKSSSNAFSIT
ncbi:MAG: tRNA (guanosine(46)-N7)-methyltransferase TrmB [Chitinophagaceae bacterium]